MVSAPDMECEQQPPTKEVQEQNRLHFIGAFILEKLEMKSDIIQYSYFLPDIGLISILVWDSLKDNIAALQDIFDFVLPKYLLLTQGTELRGLAYSGIIIL